MQSIYIKDYDTTVDFPDDTPPDVMQQALQQQFPAKTGGLENKGKTPTTATDVPKWGQDSPYLYGAYGALKGVGEAVKNIPESALNTVTGMLTPLMHPVDTAKGAYKLATGDADTWSALKQGLSDRYGSMENIGKTAMNDPVGMFTDISTLYSGAGALAKGANALSKAGGASKLAGALTEAGAKIDPLLNAGKAVKAVAPKAGEVPAAILGMTTGTGKEAVKQAFKGGDDFRAGMRGKFDMGNVLDDALNSLESMKEQRRADYQNKLAEISTKGNVAIDKAPIMNKLNEVAKSYRINLAPDEAGNIIADMSKSTLDRSARTGISELIDDVTKWNDWTPLGVDALRQRVDDFYAPTKNSRALVTQLRSVMNEEIAKKVPEYAQMTGDYSKMSRDIEEIRSNLLNGKRDTALRKLNTVFRDVNDYRREVLGNLDEKGGGNLMEKAAGVSMNSVLPRGYFAKTLPSAGAGVAAFFGHPGLAAILGAAESPRLVGEMTNAAGRASRGVGSVLNLLPEETWKALYQARGLAGQGAQ